MKRLLTILTLSLFLSTALVVPALAEHYWQLKMSEPRATQQLRTFNVEYTALSTDASDQITLQLLQNGSIIGSQTTKPGGDSGVFTVTVPSDGTYTYAVQGTSSVDGDVQTTPNQTITVTTPATTTVSVVRTTTDANGAAGAAAAQTGGQVNGTNNQQGTVGEDGASTEKDDEKDVLGAEDNQDQDGWSNFAVYLAIIVAIIALYLFFYGEDKVSVLLKRIFKR